MYLAFVCGLDCINVIQECILKGFLYSLCICIAHVDRYNPFCASFVTIISLRGFN